MWSEFYSIFHVWNDDDLRLPISDENIVSLLIELIKLKCVCWTVRQRHCQTEFIYGKQRSQFYIVVVEPYSPKGPPNIHAHRVQPEECSQKEKEHTNGWKREKGINKIMNKTITWLFNEMKEKIEKRFHFRPDTTPLPLYRCPSHEILLFDKVKTISINFILGFNFMLCSAFTCKCEL